ncbi:MAG: hypothetical protein QOG99_1342 [Frankiales bacterium]|nr:hypothetical protein [Frankiales bacterium]
MARRTVQHLEEHPNISEILGVLAHLAHIGDEDLRVLAEAWTNNGMLAAARDRALSPESPLVLEVLAAFEAVADLFWEDLAGEAAYVTVDPTVTATALKAVRDAIAAAYAKPILTKPEHTALMGPWLAAFPVARVAEPDLGPSGATVKLLLAALPRLAARCHDVEGRALFDALVELSYIDESDRAGARDSAFHAAVLTSRRRVWALVERSGAEGLSRPCYDCSVPSDPNEVSRVLGVVSDAACALLVADAVPDELLALLTRPVRDLIPEQRSG